MTTPSGEQADVSRIGAPLPGDEPVTLPDDPDAVRRLAESALRMRRTFEQYEAAALGRAVAGRKTHRPTPKDLVRACNRLSSVVLTLSAINKCIHIAEDCDDEAESVLILIGEASRSAARAVDAALQVLQDGPAVGCFADDLADD